jgi:hypothetical protein
MDLFSVLLLHFMHFTQRPLEILCPFLVTILFYDMRFLPINTQHCWYF